MRFGKLLVGAGLVMGIAGLSSVALADSVVTLTGGSLGGEPALATANFHFTGNTLVLTLTNDVDGPHAAGSLLGGIQFHMAPVPSPGTTSISSALGTLIDISSSGVVSDYSAAHTPAQNAAELGHWQFSQTGDPSTFQVNTNDPLIIGYGDGGLATSTYTSANDSIDGNGGVQHQPFVQKTGQFTFTIQGVTANTVIDSASFLFGTAFTAITNGTTTIVSTPPGQVGGPPVPLPSSLVGGAVLFAVVAGSSLLKKRRMMV